MCIAFRPLSFPLPLPLPGEKVDPDMSRTVLVTTKLDTKLPQFGASEDLEDFLMYVWRNLFCSLLCTGNRAQQFRVLQPLYFLLVLSIRLHILYLRIRRCYIFFGYSPYQRASVITL